MKVLLCIRGDYLKNFAGDSMVVLKTAEVLKKIGVITDINSGDITDYSSYDLIHLFNITRMGETYKYYKQAHKFKKNIVLTPMYWNMTRYYSFKKDIESIKLWEKCKLYRKEILTGCKISYPSSSIEDNMLKSDFGESIPSEIIYNGVEVEHEETPLYNLKERYNLNNYILCVGRITPEKNQLTLAKVCSKIGINLVLIGNIADKRYFEECKKNGNVVYLGFVDSYNIYNAYRFAKVHVLPSYVEATGMSSMEAAASGCKIVTTLEGSGREYFKDMAYYCDPYNEESILNAIELALKQRKNSKLKNVMQQYYSWDAQIRKLHQSYLRIINDNK